MQALRNKISDLITNELFERFSSPSAAIIGVQLADRILAIPEIAEALREKQHGSHDRHIKLDKGALAKITESLKAEPPSDTLR